MHYDNLEHCEVGGAADFFKSGATWRDVARRRSACPAALRSKVNPIAATGIANVWEVATHLRGEGGDRQIEGAKVGLTHVIGLEFGLWRAHPGEVGGVTRSGRRRRWRCGGGGGAARFDTVHDMTAPSVLPTSPVYDTIGQDYIAHRRVEPRWAAVINEQLGDGRVVVNVGAGTGNYEPEDRAVVAIEPSTVMVGQRATGAAPAGPGQRFGAADRSVSFDIGYGHPDDAPLGRLGCPVWPSCAGWHNDVSC